MAQNHASRDHGSKVRRILVGRGDARDKSNPRSHFSTGNSDQGIIQCHFRVRLRPRGGECELKSGGGDDVRTVSTLKAASATTKTTTRLLAEMGAVHAAQMREMTELVAAATAGNTPAPPHKEGQAQAKTQIHMNLAGTLRMRYLPPRGVKTTGIERNGRAVCTY